MNLPVSVALETIASVLLQVNEINGRKASSGNIWAVLKEKL